MGDMGWRSPASRDTDGALGTVVFDGDCGFCTWSAQRLDRWSGGGLAVVPWQRTDLTSLALTEEDCRLAVQFVGGSVHAAGGRAVGLALLRCRQPWRACGSVLLLPVLEPVVERAYRLVASHRHRLPGATPACRLDDDPRGGVRGHR